MSTAKAGKLLAKALDNSSKEEATTAFGMAWTYAERAGIRLSTIHRVEVVEVKGGSISPDRERELVNKYNAVLKRAKDLTEELATAKRHAESYLDKAAAAKTEADLLRKQLAAGGITTDMQEIMDAAKKLSAYVDELEASLTNANEQIEHLERQLAEARSRTTGGDGGYQLRVKAARAEERERATYLELEQTRKTLEATQQKLREVEADKADLSVQCVDLDERYSERAIRCNNLARENAQQRDRMLQLEKDNAALTRQLQAEKAARYRDADQAAELAKTLQELIEARTLISEQLEEIDALRSTRRALQIELDKHTDSPLKKLFGF